MSEPTKLPFMGTPQQEQQLKDLVELHKDEPGSLVPVLQGAQEIYGYLPIEVQTMIAQFLDIPLADVYGVATFYSQFSLEPKGKYQVNVCLGTACYVKGADKVLEAFENRLGIKNGECTEDGLFSIEATRCVGACGLAPVILVNEDVYGKVSPDQVDGIVKKYLETEAKGGDQA